MRRFLQIVLTFFGALTIVFSYAAVAQARYFVITNFHADITINEDGTINVTETIETYFNEQRHGIYREIPFRYRNELGDKMLMPIKVLSVKDENGNYRQNKVSRQGNVINIRIGDPNRYIYGRQVYVISYNVDNALLYLKDHDELYWNVTGNYWLTTIDSVSASVTIKSSKTANNIITACYTGLYGSSASDCKYQTFDNGASFGSTHGFNVGSGMTIVFGWDKGIVSEPSAFKQFWWSSNLVENWVFIFPIVILLFMIRHWYKRGRDPKVYEAIAPLYEPPRIGNNVLTPSQAGALVDERLDSRDLTAGIVGLATKGFIEMKELEDHDYNLKLLKEPDDTLDEFERLLIAKLFRGEKSEIQISELKNKFYMYISDLRYTLYDELVTLKCFVTHPGKVRTKYFVIGFLVLAAGVFLLSQVAVYSPIKGVIAGILSGLAVIGFANAMPVKTRIGSAAKIHIKGFEEFMTRADKDRIERMGPSLYYKYLPYAIALNVVDSWTKAFEGLLTEPPKWFVSQPGVYMAFSAGNFSKSITSASSHLGSAMFSAPRSSGSAGGGGGFSGGGGGGGGGGSW